MNKTKTIAQEALEIIEPIPAGKWTTLAYSRHDCCCLIGHLRRLTSNDPTDYSNAHSDTSFSNTFRLIGNKFLQETIDEDAGVYMVNDTQDINGYKEPETKDRCIHFVKDMIEAGY